MARIATDPNYSSPTFPRATAGTDLFLKEDVQALAAAVSTHVHDGAGKGLAVAPGAATIPGTALTNGSVTLAKLAADSVDSSKIVDGTIATADLANSSVTNAKLASDTARLSLLVNGGLEVWSRGNGPFTTAVFGPDRWLLQVQGGDTLSVSKDTANTDGSSACAVCTYTHSAGSFTGFTQHLKKVDGHQLQGRTVSASVRVRTSVANTVRILLTTDGTAPPLVYSAYHSGSGTYQTLTVTVTVPTDATYVQVGPIFGPTDCTAYVDNAMLVVGSVAADYAPLHPADDLARCLRYYEKVDDFVFGTGQCSGAAAAQIPIRYYPKGGTPTVTASGSFVVTAAGGGTVTCTGTPAVTPAKNVAQINATVASGLVAGNATLLQNNGGSFAIEFNP